MLKITKFTSNLKTAAQKLSWDLIFGLIFFFVLLFSSQSHRLWFLVVFGLLVLFLWKIISGLAWHNLFFLIAISFVVYYLSLWTNAFFWSFSWLSLMILFLLAMKRSRWIFDYRFYEDFFFFWLYFYIIFVFFSLIFIYHWPYSSLILLFGFINLVLLAIRSYQLKTVFKTYQLLALNLIDLEIFWLISLLPLNYLKQALMVVLWSYLGFELLRRGFSSVERRSFIFQSLLFLFLTVLLSL